MLLLQPHSAAAATSALPLLPPLRCHCRRRAVLPLPLPPPRRRRCYCHRRRCAAAAASTATALLPPPPLRCRCHFHRRCRCHRHCFLLLDCCVSKPEPPHLKTLHVFPGALSTEEVDSMTPSRCIEHPVESVGSGAKSTTNEGRGGAVLAVVAWRG